MYHSRATFKEALKQSCVFQNVPKGQLLSVQLQNFTNFYSFCMYIMLLNLVHILKCETSLTLLAM